jgi:hypothetical protein
VSVEVQASWTNDVGQEVSRHAKFWCGHDPAPALPEPDRLEDGIIVGDHTFFLDNRGFFLDNRGLSILELAEPTAARARGGVCWSDPDQTKVTTHDPEPTGLVIPLGSRQTRQVSFCVALGGIDEKLAPQARLASRRSCPR